MLFRSAGGLSGALRRAAAWRRAEGDISHAGRGEKASAEVKGQAVHLITLNGDV